ncbi:MAG: glycosyltransferase family 2 protein [Planctomycetota bacterium]
MPLFSVIVATYNNAPYLGAALDTVADQEFTDYELVVVDDGSTDETPAILKPWRGRARVIRQENAGVAAARNAGCEAATGEYAVFLDGDDLWFPWTLATLAEAIQAGNRPAVLGLTFRDFTDESQLADIERRPIEFAVEKDYLAGAGRHRFFMGTAHTMIRLDAVRRAGGFRRDMPVCEDVDLFLRAGTEPGFVMLLQPVVLGYRKHATSLTKNVEYLYQGALELMRQEQRGSYPGGLGRRDERRLQVLVRTRAASLKLVRARRLRLAFHLYRHTLGWNLRAAKFRYLLGLPLRAVAVRVRRG